MFLEGRPLEEKFGRDVENIFVQGASPWRLKVVLLEKLSVEKYRATLNHHGFVRKCNKWMDFVNNLQML